MARTLLDKTVDQFLTTYLINDVFSRHRLRLLPETKLQKLVFLSEKSMIDDRCKGFNFYFIKLIHGPYSAELKSELNRFTQIGYLNDFGLKPTTNLKMIVEDFQKIIDRNQPFFQKIQRVNDVYALMPLNQLLRIIYSMPWGRGDRTIADIPQRTPMLYPMKPNNIALEFEITENEAENLLLNFDPEAVEGLSQATEDMRKGRVRTYEQVFSDL